MTGIGKSEGHHWTTCSLESPAVLVTAASDAHDIAQQHGFDDVLQKPVGVDALMTTLGKLLGPR
jgi:CheY-like chemotaxis protein